MKFIITNIHNTIIYIIFINNEIINTFVIFYYYILLYEKFQCLDNKRSKQNIINNMKLVIFTLSPSNKIKIKKHIKNSKYNIYNGNTIYLTVIIKTSSHPQ